MELTHKRCCSVSHSSLCGFQAFSSFELPEFLTTAWPTAHTAHDMGTAGEELGWGLLSALGAYLVSPPQILLCPCLVPRPKEGPGGRGGQYV